MDAYIHRKIVSFGRNAVLTLSAAIVVLAPHVKAQQFQRLDREREQTMLENVASDVRKYYYDPKLHGLDWDALVNETKANIAKALDVEEANAQIAALVERLNDSHTSYIPPRHSYEVDNGFQFKVIGNRCFITKVTPKSDAESKGMRAGDQLLTIDGFNVDRASTPKLKQAMYLMPRSKVHVQLRGLDGKILDLNVNVSVKGNAPVFGLGDESWALNQSKIDRQKRWDEMHSQVRELGPELMVLRIPAFFQVDEDVDSVFKKAKAHSTLIVDLRGCPGGRVDSVESYLGDIFDHDIKIGDWVQRNKTTPTTAKGNRKGAFRGDLIVLVDSETASGGEIFARVVQLQQRGTILGDHSSGRTMESNTFEHKSGFDPVYIYGDSVTVGDTIMSDGKSLEHIGVEPDRITIPTAADLAAGRDPVLAFAASLANFKLSPEDAAKLFPSEPSDE